MMARTSRDARRSGTPSPRGFARTQRKKDRQTAPERMNFLVTRGRLAIPRGRAGLGERPATCAHSTNCDLGRLAAPQRRSGEFCMPSVIVGGNSRVHLPETLAASYIEEARRLKEADRFDEAETVLREAIKSAPNNSD